MSEEARKDTQEMSTLEWIFSKKGMLKALKDFRTEAPVTAPILYASYVAAAAGLVATFAAGPLGFPAVAAAGLTFGCAAALTCVATMISFVAVSVGQELGYFRKKTAGAKTGGTDGRRSAPQAALAGPALQADLAAKAAFNAEAPAAAAPAPVANQDGPRPSKTGPGL